MRKREKLEARVARLEAQLEAIAQWVAIGKGDGGDGRLVWKPGGDWVLVEPVPPPAAAEENDVD